MSNNSLNYLKDRGHGWVAGITAIIILVYIIYANENNLPESNLFYSIVIVLVAALTSLFSLLSLIIIALIKKSDMGELKDVIHQLILGLLVSLVFSLIGILNMFGIIKFI